MNFATRGAAVGPRPSKAAASDDNKPAKSGERGRRPSVYEQVVHHSATETESRSIWAFVRAWASMYGAITFWVGTWSTIDNSINGSEFLLWQHIKDIGIGGALLVATDSYYSVGFIPGSMTTLDGFLAANPADSRCASWARAALTQLRIFGALSGSVLLWNGLYNCMYYIVPDNTLQEWFGRQHTANPRHSLIAKNVSDRLLVLTVESITAARGIKLPICIVLQVQAAIPTTA